MSETPSQSLAGLVDLSDLLTSAVGAVIDSQEKLDEYNRRRQEEFDQVPEGELAIPPLWFSVSNVAIELELSASVTSRRADAGGYQTRLACRTLSPLAVGMFGYQAAAGLRVRMQLAPAGVAQVKY